MSPEKRNIGSSMTNYTKEIRRKGWDQKALADRWQVSTRKVQRICTNPTQRDWDALAGLPEKD
jgi:hypothetical protein